MFGFICAFRFAANRLTLMPDEVRILFCRGGFRPPQLLDEPQVDWQGIRPLMLDIAQRNHNNAAALRHFDCNAINISDPEETIRLGLDDADSVREVPRALGILAQRALAHERDMAERSPDSDRTGAIAVRQELANGLNELVEDPLKIVLEVYCPKRPDVE